MNNTHNMPKVTEDHICIIKLMYLLVARGHKTPFEKGSHEKLDKMVTVTDNIAVLPTLRSYYLISFY